MRRSNEHAVLGLLYEGSPRTRAELARETGLTKPTVSAALATLAGAGLVERVEDGVSKYGAEPFRAAGARYPVLAVDVGTRHVRAQLAGLDDTLLAEGVADAEHTTVQETSRLVAVLRDRLFARAGLDPGSLASVGVGVPGVVRSDGRVARAGGIAGLDGFPLADELSHGLGVPVHVDNDVNLAATAEHRYGACREISDFALLSVGAGVGSALVLGGTVRRGARGSAGELDVLFSAGERAGLLTDPSGTGVVAGAGLHGADDVPRLFDDAAGDPAARALMERSARGVAELCAVLVAVVDVGTVVLAGGVGAALEAGARAALEKRLAELTVWPVRVLPSGLGRSGTVMGARILAVEATRDALFAEKIGRTLYKVS
ncbi:ROK family protein [Myceligenerans cantabricum]